MIVPFRSDLVYPEIRIRLESFLREGNRLECIDRYARDIFDCYWGEVPEQFLPENHFDFQRLMVYTAKDLEKSLPFPSLTTTSEFKELLERLYNLWDQRTKDSVNELEILIEVNKKKCAIEAHHQASLLKIIDNEVAKKKAAEEVRARQIAEAAEVEARDIAAAIEAVQKMESVTNGTKVSNGTEGESVGKHQGERKSLGYVPPALLKYVKFFAN